MLSPARQQNIRRRRTRARAYPRYRPRSATHRQPPRSILTTIRSTREGIPSQFRAPPRTCCITSLSTGNGLCPANPFAARRLYVAQHQAAPEYQSSPITGHDEHRSGRLTSSDAPVRTACVPLRVCAKSIRKALPFGPHQNIAQMQNRP